MFAGPLRAEDDFQYWSQLSLKVLDTKKVDWIIFSEGQFKNDAEDTNLYFISNRFKYDFIDHLSLQTNHTYLQSKRNTPSAGRALFYTQHRLELEANPYWDVGDWLKITNRNRVEFRWIEDQGSANTRLRHRWQFAFPIKEKLPLKSVYFNSEFIYNHHEHQYEENRSTPLGLSWRLTDKASLDTYWMIQSKRVNRDSWLSNQIFGTTLSLSF